jgi:hypothetical protein
MSRELRQAAIQQIIRQRNPFYANSVLKLRQRGLQRLWHHPRICRCRTYLAGFVFSTTERLTKYALIITTLALGLIIAAILIALPLTIALYLLNFNRNEISLRLVAEQSWPNYSSWLLVSSTLFCLPYCCWGLPLALTLRYYHSLHRWYTRRGLRPQLQAIHPDDPAYLSVQIARHPLMTGHVRPSQRLAHYLTSSGKITGAVTGTLAAFICLILCLKLILLLWQYGELGQSAAIFLGCPAGLYLPFLLFRSYRAGQVVAEFVLDLLQGTHYKAAVMKALDNLGMKLFEGF